jgi:hypothetical protein
MHFISQKLDDYIVEHSQKEPRLLKELTRETYQKILQPRMLSGHYQGRVLSMISKLVNPKKYFRNWNIYRLFRTKFSRRNAKKRGVTHNRCKRRIS